MTRIQLVLCDDNADDLKTLRDSADEYITTRGFCGETVCFSSAEDILRFSENSVGDSTSVYLLDVIMPKVNGIELGKRIRERDKNSAVIYISSSREYSLDAFSVRAFSYLIKPFSNEMLFSELDECLSNIKVRPQTLTIKTATGTVAPELTEIIAVEYLNHRLIFHLANGKKIESAYRRQPFNVQAEELMQTGLFLKISASFLVNCLNVQGVKQYEFVMRDGSCYRITRKYSDAKKQYIDRELKGASAR